MRAPSVSLSLSRNVILLATLLLTIGTGCAPRVDYSRSALKDDDSRASSTCGTQLDDPYYDGEVEVALESQRDAFGIVPTPSLEASEFYPATTLSPSYVAAEDCQTAWNVVDAPLGSSDAFALADPYARVRQKVPHVAELAYAARPVAKASYKRPTPQETAVLHEASSTQATRRNAVGKIEAPDVMSAAAHLDLRDPQKVFFFARMIKIASEPGQHSPEDSAKAKALMGKFAEAPIQINVFTRSEGGKVVIDHVECIDGNHRLAAGLVAGKWKTIADIPTEFLDIRVNGSRTSNRPQGVAEKDLHWLPSKVAEDPAFKSKFKQISAEEFEQRVKNNKNRYDPNLLGEGEFFFVPSSYGASGPSIALRPEISSANGGMGKNAGVPMWQVVRRTLVRDGIVSLSDFEE